MDGSKIEWTDATWNPLRGCSRVSEGCRNCYAERIAARFSSEVWDGPHDAVAVMTKDGPRWTGKVNLVESKLDQPLHWKKPRRIFVNSMSDLFHENIRLEWFQRIYDVMRRASQHSFQVLTKRSERMNKLVGACGPDGPLPNVWWGVSIEDQATADERIPFLLQTPAAVRWVSYEPALGPVDFEQAVYKSGRLPESEGLGFSWCVIGGESGPGARPFDLSWARNTLAQCKRAGVAVFVKQLGAQPVDPWADTGALINNREPARPSFKSKKGGDPSEWPEDLRVREWPPHLPQ